MDQFTASDLPEARPAESAAGGQRMRVVLEMGSAIDGQQVLVLELDAESLAASAYARQLLLARGDARPGDWVMVVDFPRLLQAYHCGVSDFLQLQTEDLAGFVERCHLDVDLTALGRDVVAVCGGRELHGPQTAVRERAEP